MIFFFFFIGAGGGLDLSIAPGLPSNFLGLREGWTGDLLIVVK
jgi:hypothetical protein